MGVKRLRRIQLGVETTPGTAVAATTKWRGEGTIQDTTEVVNVPEDIGYLAPVNRTHIPAVGGALTLDDTPATFEQLPYIGMAGIKAVTPTQDGVGSDYIYDFVFSTTAANSLKTYTLEGGDDAGAEEMAYGFVEKFTLTGKPREAIMVKSDWVARQVAPSTFTGALAVPTVEDMLFQKSKLYIDNSAGTIGSTQITNSFMGFEFSAKTGLISKFTGDGNKYFSFTAITEMELELKVTFEHDSNAVSEKAAWLAETLRLLRISVQGSALQTPGTTYSYKTMNLDFAGKWKSFEKIDEVDGNDIVTGTFMPLYSSTDTLFAKMTIVNELSALT